MSIKNSGDLSDMGLVAIGRGCCKLSKFEVQGCENVTVKGVRTMVTLLRKTLTDRIKKLHIDCVWSSLEEEGGVEETSETNHDDCERS